MRLADPDGVLETVPSEDAGRADRLGPRLTGLLLLFAFGMRGRKENRSLRPPAGRPRLPHFLQSLSCHSPSRGRRYSCPVGPTRDLSRDSGEPVNGNTTPPVRSRAD